MATHSASSADESRIRARISPILRLLDAPQDLTEFLTVLNEFALILELYRPLSKPSETGKIAQIQQLIDEVINGDIPVASHIVSARPDKRRQTLMPHYQKHPHYTVYWHKCTDIGLQHQYRALLASFLPVQTRLQTAKRREPHTFEDVAYHVGLYLRQLSAPKNAEVQILRELPREALPPASLRVRLEELYDRFRLEFRVTGELRSFGYLHRILQWFETGVWEQRLARTRVVSRSREAPRHGAGPHSGTIEYANTSSHPQDTGAPITVVAFYADLSEGHGSDADADPIQDGGKTSESVEIPPQNATPFNAIDRIALSRRRARYAAQAIEMGNQNLPITNATLTGFELKVLLKALTDINLSEWSDVPQHLRPQIAAWGACRFFTGRGPDALSRMQVQGSSGSTSSSHMMWDNGRGAIWLPCESPRHKAPDDRSRVLLPSAGFTLNVSDTLAPYLRKIQSKTQRVFVRNMDDKFSQLLRIINRAYGTNLTLNRVSNVIPGLIAQMAPNDEVMSVYFCGRPPNQHNPSVYSAVPTMRLASLFDQACERVYEAAEAPRAMASPSSFPNLISEEEEVVGSLHVPRLETIRETIVDILAKLDKCKNTPGTPVHELHNAYTAYVLLFVLATTAIRAVSTPIPAWFDIDRVTGSCFVSEKDTDRYGNARLVWLHPVLMEQLDEYARHTIRLRQHLALINLPALDKLDARNTVPLLSTFDRPNRSSDESRFEGRAPALFMLSTYAGHPTDIRPNQVEDLLGDQWTLRLVSLRHFVRTQLLQRGCSGTLINALLGHADRGQAPWGNFSTLPAAIWRKQLAEHLAPILDQMGFKVVASPVLRP